MLAAMCFVARGLHPQRTKTLGIATEKTIRPTCTYDFCLLDIPEWTQEHQKQFEELRKNTGVFVNPKVTQTHEDEYPQIAERSGLSDEE